MSELHTTDNPSTLNVADSAATGSSVGAYEARTHFSELLERVLAGEEITITRHGTAVAKLVPAGRDTTRQQRRAAIDSMLKLSEGLTLGGLRVRELINEGRR